jgi:hypothetical protein
MGRDESDGRSLQHVMFLTVAAGMMSRSCSDPAVTNQPPQQTFGFLARFDLCGCRSDSKKKT